MPRTRWVVVATLLDLLARVAPAQETPPPQVTMRPFEVKAARAVPAGTLQRWLRGRFADLPAAVSATCYVPALAVKPTLRGTLILRVRMNSAASLDQVSVASDPFPRSKLAACATQVARGLSPPSPSSPPPSRPGQPDTDQQQMPDRPPPAAAFPLTVRIPLQFTPPPVATARPGKTQPGTVPPPAKKTCGTSPAGCKHKGCPAGLVCDTRQACVPSSCGCDPATGVWTCTEDCGGGVCVPGSPPRPPASRRTPARRSPS